MVTSTVVIGFYTFKQVLIMNIKKILVAVFALSTTIAFAQEQRINEESKTIFKPHWFIQAQIGAAHTAVSYTHLDVYKRQVLGNACL